MSEETVISGRKISVTFERKVGYDNYGNATARAWIEDELPVGATDADASARALDMVNAAKAAIFDSLGLESFVDDSGVLREKHSPTVSVKQAQDKVGTAFPGTTDAGGGTNVRIMNPGDVKEPVPAWVDTLCEQKGISAIWVNHGEFGQFYKEAVKRGETPVVPNPNNPAQGGILKENMIG